MLSTTTLLLALGGCLFLVALFAASEAALAATNRVRLRHLLQMHAQDENNTAQALTSELSGDAQKFIATVTIAANLPLLAAAAITLWLAVNRLESEGEVIALCSVVVLCVIAFGQIAPRLLVERPGEQVRLWWVKPARFLVLILYPPVAVMLFIGSLILRPLGLGQPARPTEEQIPNEGEGEHEIRELVESAQASGLIEADNRELIESIFDFGDTRAYEVMTPRPDMVALPIGCSATQLLDILQQSGHSRIPLYEENIDCIIGILHARDVLACLGRGQTDFVPRELMREPLFLPESKKIDEAFATMRAGRTHLAIVIDEFGGTAGVLTVEDILEELVGEIADEHDSQTGEPLAMLEEHAALADARLHTDDLVELWGLELPKGEFDTIGGFVIERLGRAPAVGDRIVVELENETVTLTVNKMQSRRPQHILIQRKPHESSHDENSYDESRLDKRSDTLPDGRPQSQ